MNSTDPHWYDALQGNPLIEKTFTKQLAAKIKAEALSTQVKKPSGVRRLLIIGAGMVCVLGLLIVYRIDLFSLAENQKQPTASITEPHLVFKAESPQKSLTDSEWQEAIKQSDADKKMLHKESIGDRKMLLFSKKSNAIGVTLIADLAEWDLSKWNWGQSGTYYTPLNNVEEGPNPKIITAWLGLDTTAIFMGMILDPAVSQIRISDDQQQEMAKIFRNEDGNTYWFAALPERRNIGYKVESLDESGKVLTNDPYFYH